jgi:Mrp family chromosome partitioning ATPase
VNTLAGLLAERTIEVESPPVTAIREEASEIVTAMESVHDQQIQALVQQLFFRNDAAPLRHVGFAAVEAETKTAQLCLDAATVLAEAGTYDVGLIDAGLQSAPLHTQLGIAPGSRSDTAWPIAPRLWLVPRQTWLDNSPRQRIWDSSLSRLRAATMKFDFSILCFAPVSWLTARISQTCDGLVLVLAANKTRRLVAARIREQLQRTQVRLLGTVLAERRFPVPKALYRNL